MEGNHLVDDYKGPSNTEEPVITWYRRELMESKLLEKADKAMFNMGLDRDSMYQFILESIEYFIKNSSDKNILTTYEHYFGSANALLLYPSIVIKEWTKRIDNES